MDNVSLGIICVTIVVSELLVMVYLLDAKKLKKQNKSDTDDIS